MSSYKRWLVAVFGLAVAVLGTPAPAQASGWDLFYQEWINEGYFEPPAADPGTHGFIESNNDPNFPINTAYGEIWTHADAAAPTLDGNGQPVWNDIEGIQAWGDYYAVFVWDGPPNPGAWQLSGTIQFNTFGASGTSELEGPPSWGDPDAAGGGYTDYLGGEENGGQEARMSSQSVGATTVVYDDDATDSHVLTGFANNGGNDEVMEGTVTDLFATASASANVYNGTSWSLSQGSASVSVSFSAEEVP